MADPHLYCALKNGANGCSSKWRPCVKIKQRGRGSVVRVGEEGLTVQWLKSSAFICQAGLPAGLRAEPPHSDELKAASMRL